MKNFRLFLTLFAAGLLAAVAVKDVLAEECHSPSQGFSTYLGIEGQVKHMGLKKTFGRELYNHKYFDGHVFGGLKFNENIGLELGMHAGKTHNSDAGFRSKSTGNYLMLLGFTQKFRCDHFELFAGPGVSFVHNVFNFSNQKRVGKHSTVLRLLGGANYFLTESLALRGTLSWENTNRILLRRYDDQLPKIKPFNSLSLSAGVLYQF